MQDMTLIEPVPIHSILSDVPLSFSLYTHGEGEDERRYKKLVEKGNVLSSGVRAALIYKSTGNLFIRIDERPLYIDYLGENFAKINAQGDTPKEEKAKLLYQSANRIVEGVFSQPNIDTAMAKSQTVVGETIELLMNDENALLAMIRASEHEYRLFTHSLNTAIFAIGLGHFLGMEAPELAKLGFTALLHDIGKIKIPAHILDKPGPLSEYEFEMMKMHCHYSYNIVKQFGQKDRVILEGIKYHHERMDGKGYPDALFGDEIPVFARLIAICSSYSAISSHTSYHEAYSSFESLSIMKKEMVGAYDPKLLQDFIRFLGSLLVQKK